MAWFASLGLGGLHGAGLGARLLHGAIAGVIGGPLAIGLGGILGLDLGPHFIAWRVLALVDTHGNRGFPQGSTLAFHPVVGFP